MALAECYAPSKRQRQEAEAGEGRKQLPQGASPSAREQRPLDDAGFGRGKPAELLSAEKRSAAVAPEVAARLNAASLESEYAAKRPETSGMFIGGAPEELRTDLQRVAISNGHVDAPGETLMEYRTLPSFARAVQRAACNGVAAEIRMVPESASTQDASLEEALIEELATAAIELRPRLSAFEKAIPSSGEGDIDGGSAISG